MTANGSAAGERPRIAYLSWSSGEFDSRTRRMAATAIEAGYEVAVYARQEPGLPEVSEEAGYRIVRVPFETGRGVPLGRALVGLARRLARRRAPLAPSRSRSGSVVDAREPVDAPPPGRSIRTAIRDRARLISIFPLRPIAWADALAGVAEPADLWHGMWAGSLPALERLRKVHGGRTIYDARDVYLRSRGFERMGRLGRWLLRRLERRWAQRADASLTVNDAYARLLEADLGIRPAIVMNTPVLTTPPDPPPDRIRAALGLPATTRVVLYQGGLLPERGIEATMTAILEVEDAALVLLGYGALRDRLRAAASAPPYAGRVFVIDAVPPSELLEWTASADVMVMAIEPTTTNHRYTTPQKLFEAMAVGVPVVASDLPGMAAIVRETGCGVLCEPGSPASIAAAIRSVLDQTPDQRRAMRDRALAAAHDRYHWERQAETLLGVYRRLLGDRA